MAQSLEQIVALRLLQGDFGAALGPRSQTIMATVLAVPRRYLFVVHMATAERPFIRIEIFQDRNFACARDDVESADFVRHGRDRRPHVARRTADRLFE